MVRREDKQGPAFAGHWTEVSPDAMIPTTHIGELKIGEGREWQVGRDWGGMSLVVSTDIPHEDEPRRTKTFILSGTPLVKALAEELLKPQDVSHGAGSPTPAPGS